MYKLKQNLGFTLVEIIIVMAVIGILVAVSIVAFKPYEILANSRNAKRVSDILAVNSALGHWISREGANETDPYSTLGLLAPGITALTPSDGSVSGEGVDATTLSQLALPEYLNIIPKDPDGSTEYRIGVDDISSPMHVLVCTGQIELTTTYPDTAYPNSIFCQSN